MVKAELQLPDVVIRADGPHCAAEFSTSCWVCPRCAGTGGTMSRDDRDYEVFQPCPCVKARQRMELFNAAHIGRRFQNSTLDSFEPRTVEQERARQLAWDFTRMYPAVRGGLIFYGPVGTGKTHLVVGIFRELTLHKGAGCRFVDYGNLLQDLKRSFSSREGDAAVMLPLVEVDLLVIDELGKGRNTDWEETVLDDLISRRYNAGRITLCTTNYMPHDTPAGAATGLNPAYEARSRGQRASGPSLQERVGERIFSRLCEMCEFVGVAGEDYRRTSLGVSRL